VAGKEGGGEDAVAREALSELEVYISGFEVRGRDTRDEHTVYTILCRARPTAPTPADVGASKASDCNAGEGGDAERQGLGEKTARGAATSEAAIKAADAVPAVRRVVRPCWTVYRRFREFVALQKELSALAAAAVAAGAAGGDDGDSSRPSRRAGGRQRRSSAVTVPPLPRRRLFGSRSPAVLRERVWGLDAFLTQLTLLAGGAGGSECPGLASAVARFIMLAPPPPDPGA
jgi:hypothetical protein